MDEKFKVLNVLNSYLLLKALLVTKLKKRIGHYLIKFIVLIINSIFLIILIFIFLINCFKIT
jgi:hypothetical protein